MKGKSDLGKGLPVGLQRTEKEEEWKTHEGT